MPPSLHDIQSTDEIEFGLSSYYSVTFYIFLVDGETSLMVDRKKPFFRLEFDNHI